MRRDRRVLVALAVAGFAIAPPARAQSAEECVAAHGEGQDQRKSGQLLAAREKFIRCSADACPKLVRGDCEKLLGDVDANVPSIIVRARTADGNDTTAVEVIVDGQSVATRLGTAPIRLDPGERKLVFRHEGGITVERTVALVEGEKNRVIEVELVREPPPSEERPIPREPEPGAGPPVLAYVLGGVSVAALGSFAFFGLSGKSKENELDDCTPSCSDSEYDAMKNRYLIADVSLAVALLSGGAALWIGLGSAGKSKKTPAVGALPLRRGGALGVRGRF